MAATFCVVTRLSAMANRLVAAEFVSELRLGLLPSVFVANAVQHILHFVLLAHLSCSNHVVLDEHVVYHLLVDVSAWLVWGKSDHPIDHKVIIIRSCLGILKG